MTAEISSVVSNGKNHILSTTITNGKYYKMLENGITAIYTSPDYTRITFNRKSIIEENINPDFMETSEDWLCFILKTNKAISVGGETNPVLIRHVDASEIKVRRPREKTIRINDRF